MDHNIIINENAEHEVERILRQTAESLPEPQKDVPVSAIMAMRGKRHRSWQSLGRAAVILLSLLLLSSGTALAASPALRQAVIHFFTGGVTEEPPVEQLSAPISEQSAENTESVSTAENAAPEEAADEITAPVTVGNVTFLEKQVLDEHFTASYLSSPLYLDTVSTPSGKFLFYTEDTETGYRTYYQLIDGVLQISTPETHVLEGSILLGNLQGVMSYGGDTSYASIILPEMTFTMDWQQYGEDILLLDSYSERFDIGSTFGGTQNGEPLQDDYDGKFYAIALKGDTEWVEVFFWYDAQLTGYEYPFLFNLSTGETRDPLAEVDLSAYPCITDLRICDDKKTVTALAGQNHDSLNKIYIDLENGKITEETVPSAPVSTYYQSYPTSDHTVFYTVGTEEKLDGYLYDSESGVTKELFRGAAQGYVWDYGFADTYISLIGNHYAAYYKEPENEVWLLNLVDGEMQLLEGIPANHNTNFFWNREFSMLCISICTGSGASRLAFFIPGTGTGWYFDRIPSDSVHEESGTWYSEYGYIIQAVSPERDMYYLYLYEYTP